MKKVTLTSLLCCLVLPNIYAQEVALTFDDAPRHGSSLMNGDEITEKIVTGLKDSGVDDALFFVTTKNITNETALQRLEAYVDAGFHLANHSHSHQSAEKLSPKDYLADFYTSHLISQDFPGLMKLHRFPFLHQPETIADRQTIRQGITELGYDYGYVTIDNYDWYLNSKLVQAHENGLTINHENMKKLYLDSMWESIQFYDQIARESLERSPKHVLLLHENEIAALFIRDLVKHIKSKGGTIISPEEAYTDPIAKLYSVEQEFNKQGRVAAIAYSQGLAKEELRHSSENTDYLDEKLKEYNVFSVD